MRMAFGLIAILGFLIAVVLFWSQAYLPYTQQVLTQGQSAQTTAERIAGIDTTLGGRVSEHVVFQPVERGGKLFGLQVTSLNTGSSFQSHYGIQVGDVIDVIGPQQVRDMDAETAKSLALEAYQRSWDLGITRNGKHYNMPTDLAAAGAVSPGPRVIKPTAATPAAPLTPSGTPAQNQPAASAQPAQQPQQPAQPRSRQQDPNMTPLQRQMDAIMNFKTEDAGK